MKERLTGAIILVALIVLLVPELLRGPVRSAPRAVAASAEEPPLRSYTINLGDDARARDAAAQPQSAAPQPLPSAAAATPAAPLTQADTPTPAALPQTPTPAPAAPPKPSTAPSGAAAPQAPAAEASGAWMVQMGSFASRANAERLAHQLKGQGFSASVSQGTSGRHLYRVRVGPAHDHAAATVLQGKLKAAGHGGSVVPK